MAPRRCQAGPCGDQGSQSAGPSIWRAAAAILSALAKRAPMMAGRYAHAKQFKRHRRQLRSLRTWLGRLIRDIRRITGGHSLRPSSSDRPYALRRSVPQEQHQRGYKLYSFRAPEVESIGRGKAGAPYEFGSRLPSSPPMLAPRAATSSCTPRRCRGTPMTGTRSATVPRPSPARDRARLCR
jgi:IS5 family transposase